MHPLYTPFIMNIRQMIHNGVSGLYAVGGCGDPLPLAKYTGQWYDEPLEAPLRDDIVSKISSKEFCENLEKARKWDELTSNGKVDLDLLIRKAKKYDEIAAASTKRANELLDSLVLG
jgi:hypothetical protein